MVIFENKITILQKRKKSNIYFSGLKTWGNARLLNSEKVDSETEDFL